MEFAKGAGPLIFLGFLIAVVLLEAAWLIFARKQDYNWRAAAASFGVAIGKRVIELGTAGIGLAFALWVYDHRLFTLTLDSVGAWLVFFLLFELAYYWHHRLAHEVRWLWATHGVHHSANEMNFSVGPRLGWTGLISGNVLVFAPLFWLGYHPIAVFFVLSAGLFYQLFVHTELVGRLPAPIEWLLNTPSAHRVHHGSDPEYLDKNYGGVLLIWDHVFGTYQVETHRPTYGLTQPVTSNNPFRIALFEWAGMIRDVASARRLTDAIGYMFGPPGWSPENRRRMSTIRLHNPLKFFTRKATQQ